MEGIALMDEPLFLGQLTSNQQPQQRPAHVWGLPRDGPSVYGSNSEKRGNLII
jgi:hypothetical protein